MVVSLRTISISLLTISLPVTTWLGYRTIFGLNNTTSRNLQGTRNALATFEDQPIFPKTFTIEPVVDIPLPLFSVFLACARPNPSTYLTCHFREHYRRQIIGKVTLDGTNFQIKSHINRDADLYKNTEASITRDSLVGEDPRTFTWDGELYVFNNRAKHLSLIQVGDHGAKDEFLLPHFIGKKNISPVPMEEGKGIMFIDFQSRKLHVCVRSSASSSSSSNNKLELACEPFSKEVLWGSKVRRNYDADEWYFRGGTNGVELEPGVFVGFGHTTKKNKDVEGTHHDIFFWKLDTRPEKAHCFMDAVAITHGLDHKITDPTSLLHVGGMWYLFTAESNEPWKGGLVRFTNRVYRINAARCSQYGHCGHFGEV